MAEAAKKIKLDDRTDKQGLENGKDTCEVEKEGGNENKIRNGGEKSDKEGERIFLVREGIQEKRYGVIQKFATKNGFICEEELSDR